MGERFFYQKRKFKISGQGSHQLKNTSQKLIKIRDGLLDPHQYTAIRDVLISGQTFTPWYYSDAVDYANEDNFMFNHIFYAANEPTSDKFRDITPILNKLTGQSNQLSLHRIKANLYTRTDTIQKHKFHTDFDPDNMGARHWMVGIFYLNSNDGYTEFETGEIVESVGNRLVTFPGHLSHRGTSCTNEKIRALINIGYYGW